MVRVMTSGGINAGRVRARGEVWQWEPINGSHEGSYSGVIGLTLKSSICYMLMGGGCNLV